MLMWLQWRGPSLHAVEATAHSDQKLTLATIKESLKELLYEISSMKFQDPWTSNRTEIEAVYADLKARMTTAFNDLTD